MTGLELAQLGTLVVAAGLLPERAPGVEPAPGRRVRPATAGRPAAGSAPGCPRPRGPARAPPTSARSCRGAAARRTARRRRPARRSPPRYITATSSADVPDHGEVVRDHQVGQTELLLQLLEQVEDLRLDRHVQRRDRLVGDDEARFERDRAGDADPLALPAGELVRVASARPTPAARPGRAARGPGSSGRRRSRARAAAR